MVAKNILLSVVPLEQRVDRLIVRIDVTNCTDEPIVWDSDFSTYLSWDLKSDDGTSIPSTSVANVDRTESIIRKTRFVTIPPGRSFSKTIDLTGGFRHLIYGHGSAILPNGAMQHIPTGYEEQIKFDIPPTARSVLISAQYSGGGDFGGFAVWFGYSSTEIDLWTGRATSNEIRIPLLNAQHK